MRALEPAAQGAIMFILSPAAKGSRSRSEFETWQPCCTATQSRGVGRQPVGRGGTKPGDRWHRGPVACCWIWAFVSGAVVFDQGRHLIIPRPSVRSRPAPPGERLFCWDSFTSRWNVMGRLILRGHKKAFLRQVLSRRSTRQRHPRRRDGFNPGRGQDSRGQTQAVGERVGIGEPRSYAFADVTNVRPGTCNGRS